MIILLSPTKKQSLHENLKSSNTVIFPEAKNTLLNILSGLTEAQIKEDYKVSDRLAKETYASFQNINEISPAIFTYTGEAFKTLDPKSLSDADLLKAENHILIFSALYGLLKPFDPITQYRLDLLNKFEVNLKEFWKEDVTTYLNNLDRPLVNLASQEFMQLIDLKSLSVPIINIHFINEKDGKKSVVSSHAKKARGHFTRVLIENGFENLEEISVENYNYSHTEDNNYYYIKTI